MRQLDIWWNLSNTDNIGPLKWVLVREVSSFLRCPWGGVQLNHLFAHMNVPVHAQVWLQPNYTYTTPGARLANDKGPTHFHPHRSPSSSTSSTTLCVLCIQTPLWNSETLLQNSRTPLYVHLSFAGHLSVFFKNCVNHACQNLLTTFIDCYTDRWYLTLTRTFANLGKDV